MPDLMPRILPLLFVMLALPPDGAPERSVASGIRTAAANAPTAPALADLDLGTGDDEAWGVTCGALPGHAILPAHDAPALATPRPPSAFTASTPPSRGPPAFLSLRSQLKRAA